MKSKRALEALQQRMLTRREQEKSNPKPAGLDLLNVRMLAYLTAQSRAVRLRQFMRCASPQSSLHLLEGNGEYFTKAESIEIGKKATKYLRSRGQLADVRKMRHADAMKSLGRR